MANSTKIIVLYGGASTEHEVSLHSAKFLLKHLNPEKYQIEFIGVGKDGRWYPQDIAALKASNQPSLPLNSQVPSVKRDTPVLQLLSAQSSAPNDKTTQTVVFPIIHGTSGEDGTLQGLLELAGVAYVGPDTLGSAIGMDKIVSKKLAELAGVPILPYVEIRQSGWIKDPQSYLKKALSTLKFPLFVKPARLGSSVGISKVKVAEDLKAACENALKYDDKILIEQGINAREIECAVLGADDPDVSVPGEVIPHAEFYSYEAKYLDKDGASIAIPAKLSAEQAKYAQQTAKKVFQALELYGMARVDLFLDKDTDKFYFNEVNTIPGFTVVSQYPMLWKASGLSEAQLLDKLIELAINRSKVKKSRETNFLSK